jgi:transcriptional regulator with XRE-family HTH domain
MRRPRFHENRQFYAEVGHLIAKARAGRLTQQALGTKALLTRTSIINIEKGSQQILLHTLVDIARALGVAPTDLLQVSNDLEVALRDKSAKGVDWVRASTETLKIGRRA